MAGHLHVRTTDWIDGVRFEEVSLGYPRHWRRDRGIDGYLREILPGPAGGPMAGRAGASPMRADTSANGGAGPRAEAPDGGRV